MIIGQIDALQCYFFVQWCPEGKVSNWYPIYRVVVALFFVGVMIGHMAIDVISGSVNAGKWFLFMTDISILFLTIHYVIDAYLTVSRWFWERFSKGGDCKPQFHAEKMCA